MLRYAYAGIHAYVQALCTEQMHNNILVIYCNVYRHVCRNEHIYSTKALQSCLHICAHLYNSLCIYPHAFAEAHTIIIRRPITQAYWRICTNTRPAIHPSSEIFTMHTTPQPRVNEGLRIDKEKLNVVITPLHELHGQSG